MSDSSANTQTPRKQTNPKGGKSGPPGETVKTWSFDSVGPRKYAVQIRKASNGNPCLRLVEGVPNKAGDDFRKFDITIWSEDFDKLWNVLDEVRAYMTEHDIRTPAGHKYVPGGKGKKTGKRQAQRASE